MAGGLGQGSFPVPFRNAHQGDSELSPREDDEMALGATQQRDTKSAAQEVADSPRW